MYVYRAEPRLKVAMSQQDRNFIMLHRSRVFATIRRLGFKQWDCRHNSFIHAQPASVFAGSIADL